MSRKIFGTDGVRGLANQAPIDPETALALGRAIAYVFKGRGGRHHRIVIGKDTRLSGYMIENALSAGICSMGGESIFLGPLPTPGIAFVTQAMRADAGVVISASHNPFYDNGIKFFSHDGFKLPDEVEAQMEALMAGSELKQGMTREKVGRAYRIEDAAGRYLEYLKATFPKDLNLNGIKIVVDAANGAAYRVAPLVFEELGADVIPLGVEPNGTNINERCGALHPEILQEKVKQSGADLGIALDGDADRLVMVDERGEVIHGDALMAMCALDLSAKGHLVQNTLVTTVMSNLGLWVYLRDKGLKIHQVQVGDRYVIEAMRKSGYNFGGEQSGHLIFRDHSTTGDGILAALQILAILRRANKPLSQCAQGPQIFPQVLLNVPVRQKKDLAELPEVQALCRQVEGQLGDKGRLLLRYSGTEALLRIMLEGEDAGQIRQFAEALKLEAERSLGKG